MSFHSPIVRDARPYYAGAVTVRRLIETARKCKIDVGGVMLAPDGTACVFDRKTAEAVALKQMERK